MIFKSFILNQDSGVPKADLLDSKRIKKSTPHTHSLNLIVLLKKDDNRSKSVLIIYEIFVAGTFSKQNINQINVLKTGLCIVSLQRHRLTTK